MSDTNGAAAPNGEAAPETLPNEAIDGALAEAEAQHVDTQARKDNEELRAHNRALQERVGELVASQARSDQKIDELVNGMRDAKGRGWEYEIQRLRGIMHKAVDDGDKETFKAAEHDLLGLMSQGPAGPKGKEKTTDDPPAQKIDPAAEAWMRNPDNSWFHTDDELRSAMIALEGSMSRKYPDITTRLQKAREEIVKTFPHKFPNQARNNPPAVSRPGPQATTKPKPKTKTVADLPADAKLALDRIKRRDPSFKDEDYVNAYQWDK